MRRRCKFIAAGSLLLSVLVCPSMVLAGHFTLPIPPTLTSYWNNATAYVIFVDVSGNLYSLSYNTSTGGPWITTFLAQAGTFVPGSPLVGYVDNYGNGRLFFYVHNGNGTIDIGEQRGNPPSGNFNDLTILTGGASWPQAVDSAVAGATAGFTDARGAELAHSLFYPSNLVGFQDSLGTHHVFYFCNTTAPPSGPPTYLCELYSSDSADLHWFSNYLTSVPQTAGNIPIGLTALWDGSVEHLYWNPTPTELSETYNSGGWFTHILSAANWNAPYYNVTAASPKTGWQYVWGANAPIGLGATAAEWYNNGSWHETTVTATNYSLGGGTTSFVWKDNTTGLGGSGLDGGLFYIDSSNCVQVCIPTLSGCKSLACNASTNRRYSPTQNQLTGFAEGLSLTSNLHVFWIDTSGQIWEGHARANSIGPGLGTWQTDIIGSGAAH